MTNTKPLPPGRRGFLTLDQAIEETERQKVEEGLAAGHVSVRSLARFLSVEATRAWRLLRKYGYVRTTQWIPPAPPRRKKRP